MQSPRVVRAWTSGSLVVGASAALLVVVNSPGGVAPRATSSPSDDLGLTRAERDRLGRGKPVLEIRPDVDHPEERCYLDGRIELDLGSGITSINVAVDRALRRSLLDVAERLEFHGRTWTDHLRQHQPPADLREYRSALADDRHGRGLQAREDGGESL